MKVAYVNKKFVPLNKAKVSVLDRGFLYGDGVFETMRSYNGIVFRLERHLDRLYKSLKTLRISPEITKSKMQKIVYKLLKKNRLSAGGGSAYGGKNAYIKIVMTRGKSSGLLVPTTQNPQPTTVVYTLPYRKFSKDIYKKGIKVCTTKRHVGEESKIRAHKTLNYLPNILSRYEAKKNGFEDAVFINKQRLVSEATSSNIFLVKRNKTFTPRLKCDILPGITRGEVIKLFKRFLENKVNEIPVREKTLYNADEIFLTNSLNEVIPIVEINKKSIGNGKPGPITKKMMGVFKYSVDEYCRKHKKER